ncbi:MAG: DNA gyrase subunit A [Burkholderiaceae bacterium]|nr:DNA gyrase subunit A [Burkholderiaceae bacterium]
MADNEEIKQEGQELETVVEEQDETAEALRQNIGEVEPVSLETEMKRSYLDYAMSVIVGRALPDVRDGLKPVHRRVLFAMEQMGNTYSRPTKKSARVVGDVIGKYHPHGDQAAYDTIVRMAQPFSLRYPLVYGQGNFGSLDGDAAAAMRYTEVKLQKLAGEMLADIRKETVDFVPNYDNTETEPTVLPTRLPNLLINGSSGIAVGMATNIPPHNLGETVDACVHLLNHPEATIEDLIKFVPAPDFPTGGIIFGLNGVHEGYRTGRGRVLIRSKTHYEEFDKGRRTRIVVDEIPYQVNKRVLVESIAHLINEKRIEGISDLRDETDKDGVRIVIELKSGVVADVVLNNLFKLTQLQDSFGINMVALVDGQPQLLNLKQIIDAFLMHRREVVTRRTIFELRESRGQGHVLEGLAVALANIDEFLAIIRNAPTPDVAKAALMGRGWASDLVASMLHRVEDQMDLYRPEGLDAEYGFRFAEGLYYLSDVQAEKILQMRLQRLTGLEQDKIVQEYKQVSAHIADLLDILAKPERVTRIIEDDLLQLKSDYNDERRSDLDPTGDPNFDPRDLIPRREMVVTMTRDGYIKAQQVSDYQAQKRGGQGKKAATMKEGDMIDQLFIANSHDRILCFSDFGRMYCLDVYTLPEGSRTSKGRPIINSVPLSEGERITVVLPIQEFDDDHYVFMATANGVVKKTRLKDFANVRRSGINAAGLDEGDHLIGVAITNGENDIMLFSDAGKAVRFAESDVRPMGRNARGVRGMQLEDDQKIIALLVTNDETTQTVLTATENGFGKRTEVSEYTRHGRGTKGMIAIQTSERNGKVVAATLVKETDEIMMLTQKGKIVRTEVSDIRVLKRATQGVTLIGLKDDVLAAVQRIAEEDVVADSTIEKVMPVSDEPYQQDLLLAD